jgi:hypothetical protein
MTTIRGASLATLALLLATACSQGADTDPFSSFPPAGPGPGSASPTDGGQATFGVDTEGAQGDSSGRPTETAEGDPDESGTPPSGQDCCVGGPDPGCNDATVEACVCNEIPFCCETGWEKVCGSAVDALGCGHCGAGETGEPPPGDTGDPPPGDTGDEPLPPQAGCCEPQMTPGCTDVGVEACVCNQDAYCCDTAWDQLCVDNVAMFMCGDCGGGMMPPPGESTCCSEQLDPGCDNAFAEACVCLVDAFCCDVQWDATCAILAGLFMCVDCS